MLKHLIHTAERNRHHPALIDSTGCHSYGTLLSRSRTVAARLLQNTEDLNGARIGILCTPGLDYVAGQWGIWMAGGVVVPLAPQHPSAEWRSALESAEAGALVADSAHAQGSAETARELDLRCVASGEAPALDPGPLPEIRADRPAMMLFTSGTTSRPKGVVTSHATTEAQVRSLVEAWEWSDRDRILHVLPLHHIHGVINVLGCALYVGACCEFMPFDEARVWRRLGSGDVTLFMAVPTIYRRLLRWWDAADDAERSDIRPGLHAVRLMVSGSAALPVSVLEAWRERTGHTLLERYGMTEIGMALSNPLHGERVPGSVGTPLPGVGVRVVDERGAACPEGEPGEIQVRGATVFQEYWGAPEATRTAFDNGWFRTGDIAVIRDGVHRILGRASVDIIKTGGYKVSALEIEEVFREHADIVDLAVVGLPDEEWGERVTAVVVPRDGTEVLLEPLREWGRIRLAAYKLPSLLVVRAELPRNAMGKVNKPELIRSLAPHPDPATKL